VYFLTLALSKQKNKNPLSKNDNLIVDFSVFEIFFKKALQRTKNLFIIFIVDELSKSTLFDSFVFAFHSPIFPQSPIKRGFF